MPAGSGPPFLHRHDPDEIYRLQRGQLAIYLEDDLGEVRRIVADPGGVVDIRGGRAHTVRNESDAEALAYVVFTPGTELEHFVRAAAALAADGVRDVEDILALAQRHGMQIAGPVPTTG